MYKEKKQYLTSIWYKVTLVLAVLVILAISMPLKALAANVTTGKIGDNDGATWTYDNDTDTLVLTGQMSNVGSLNKLFPNVKKITLEDCTIGGYGYSSGLFKELTQVESIEFHNVDTSQMTNMSRMFEGCINLKSLDLSGFDTSNVVNMYFMFYNCSGLESLDISSFQTSEVTDMGGMFFGCSNVKKLDVSGFDTSKVKNMAGMFNGCSGVEELDVSNFDTGNVTGRGLASMFINCAKVEELDVSGFRTEQVTDMSFMFNGCASVKSLDLSGFDTAEVEDMYNMFEGCAALETLDISSFNTSKVTSMSHMFAGCSNLKTLNVSSFNTENVTSMFEMFSGCAGLEELDLANFNTRNVTTMYGMFDGCSGLKSLNISSFNTENVTNMLWMFRNCSGLKSLDVSSFDTTNVVSMYAMFMNCSGLTSIDVSNFNTANATGMNEMFRGCSNLTSLDLSSFDMSKSNNSNLMLRGCRKIKTIQTPKAMKEYDNADLEDFYYDSNGKRYACLFTDCCNTTLVRQSSPFSDVPESSWQYEYVKFALNNDLMTGKGTTEEEMIIFDPNTPMTRAEFVQTLYNKEFKPAVTYTDRFPDVPEGKWYTNAILWAAEKNIVSGKGDGNFDVNGKITRQEMATILYKYANYKGYTTEERAELDGYTDIKSISSWAVENMKWALSYGVMKGKGDRLAPLENATRAECATMLCNFMTYYGGY